MAKSCHTSLYELLKKNSSVDQALIAKTTLSLANICWRQKDFSEALNYAQQALIINESITSNNDLNLAINLGVIANIHHGLGKASEALTAATRALTLLERSVPSDSYNLGSLLNNIAAIQMTAGAFSDARNNLDRALKIYEKKLPEEHPKRISIQNAIKQITQIEQNQGENLTDDSKNDFLPVIE